MQAPGVFSYTVVVARNNYGIPGLIADTDRVFNVTCDYSAVLGVPLKGGREQERDERQPEGCVCVVYVSQQLQYSVMPRLRSTVVRAIKTLVHNPASTGLNSSCRFSAARSQ